MENKAIIDLNEYIFMKEQLRLYEKQLAMITCFIRKEYKQPEPGMIGFHPEDKNIVCLSIPGKQLDKFINELAGVEGKPVDIIRDCIG